MFLPHRMVPGAQLVLSRYLSPSCGRVELLQSGARPQAPLMAAKPSERFARAWEGEAVPQCPAVTAPLGTALSLVQDGPVTMCVSQAAGTPGCKHGAAKGDRRLSRCQGHAARVPASAWLSPGCGERPCSPASTSSLPAHPCSGTVCLCLDPKVAALCLDPKVAA